MGRARTPETMTATGSSTAGTQAVDRAAQLLALVVEADEPMSFSDLAEETGLARSTTSRLLAALENRRLLDRDASGGFVAGSLFALYATRHERNSQLARLAEPILQKLGAETGETVNLAVPRGDLVVQVAQVDAIYVLAPRDWLQVTVPPHCSALGKVLYAFGALSVPEGDLEQRTPRSLASSAALRQQLPGIRRRGYAVTRSELEIGLDGIASPIRGADGEVLAALGVSGPSARMGGQLDELGRLVNEQGESLSQLLGRRSPKEGFH
ncbi:MAG: IclR family transcriptional regulator [Actinomycetes bacterium]